MANRGVVRFVDPNAPQLESPWRAQVDEILKHYIPTPAHREATLRWYRPAEQAELAKYYQRILVDPLRAEKPPRKP